MKTAARILAVGAMAVTALGAGLAPAEARTADEGTVTANGGLSVRSAPTTHARSVGALAQGATIPVTCWIDGSIVGGNTRWYSLPPSTGEWVSARYVKLNGSSLPECGAQRAKTLGKPESTLVIRRGPHAGDQNLGLAPGGKQIQLQCKVRSQSISGNTLWYKLRGSQGWVTARYVDNVGTAPGWCNV